MVVDDNLPLAKGESKLYSYNWNGKFNLGGDSDNNKDGIYEFELGARVSPKEDLVKVPLEIIFK
jgi:hypothetical protein